MVCILKPEGGDKLMYFDKNLENIGLKIVKENGNWDDIKAEKDLQEIIRVINEYTVNHPYCSNFKPPFLAARF